MMRWRDAPLAAMLVLIGCDRAPRPTEAETITPSQVAFDRIEVAGSRGRYVADRDGSKVEIPFDLPAARLAPERAHFGTRLGETGAGAVVMLDQYASRPDGGRCADGTETFVRVFSLQARRQTAVLPVDSCLNGVRATGEGAEWVGDDRIRILSTPPRVYRITDDGKVEMEGER